MKEGVGQENREQQTGVPTSPSSSGGFNQLPPKGYVKKACLWNLKFGGKLVQAMYMLHVSGFEAHVGVPACKEH